MEKRSWTKRIFALMLAVITAITSWSIDWGSNAIISEAGEYTCNMTAGSMFFQEFVASEYSQLSGSKIKVNVSEVTESATLQVYVFTNVSPSAVNPGNASNADFTGTCTVSSIGDNVFNDNGSINLIAGDHYYVCIKADNGNITLNSITDSGTYTDLVESDEKSGTFISASPKSVDNTESVTFVDASNTYILGVGDSTTLSVSEVAPGRDVVFSSSNQTIATINSSGLVTAKAAGVITVEAWIDGSTAPHASHSFYVVDITVNNKKTYNGTAQSLSLEDLTFNPAANGDDKYSISGATTATNVGDTITISGEGKYAGLTKAVSVIQKLDIETCTQVNPTPFEISGDNAIASNIILKDASGNEVTLSSDTDFTTAITSTQMSGSNKIYNVKVTAKPGSTNYEGSITLTQSEVASGESESIKSVVNSISVNDVEYNTKDQTSDIINSIVFDYVGEDPGLVYGSSYTVRITDAEGTDKTNNVKNAGKYYLYVTGKGPYKSTESVYTSFRVLQKDISNTTDGTGNFSYSLSAKKYTYSSGLEYKPTLTAKYFDEDITYSDIEYKNNTSVGTAKVVITGNGNYTGTHTEEFIIAGDLSGAKITVVYDGHTKSKIVNGGDTGIDIEYSGGAISGIEVSAVYVPGVNETDVMLSESDYAVSFDNSSSVGNKKRINITGKAGTNYDGGSAYVTFDVVPKDISDGGKLVLGSASDEYDTKAHKPQGTISYKNKPLLEADYTISYTYTDNNGQTYADGFVDASSDAKTYKVTASLSGNYTGTISADYRITPLAITSEKIGVVYDSVAAPIYYNGTARTINLNNVKVYYETEDNVISSANYTLDSNGYKNNVKAGTATASLNGTGNLSGGPKTFNFEIIAGHEALHFRVDGKEYGEAIVSNEPVYLPGAGEYAGSLYSKTYTGSAYPKPTVEVYSDSEEIKALDHYTVSYAETELTNAKDSYIKVTGKGGYAGIVAYLKVQIKTKSILDSDITAEFVDDNEGYVLKREGNTLTKGTDYTVVYKNNETAEESEDYPTAPGMYTATFKGINNYASERKVENIEIGHSIQSQVITIKKLQHIISQQGNDYNATPSVVNAVRYTKGTVSGDGQIPFYGEGVRPKVYVQDASGNTISSDKYKVEFDGGYTSGVTTVKVTGQGDYYGVAEFTYEVVPMYINEAIDKYYQSTDSSSGGYKDSLLYIEAGTTRADVTQKDKNNLYGNKVVYSFGDPADTIPQLVYNVNKFNEVAGTGKEVLEVETGYNGKTVFTPGSGYTSDPAKVGDTTTLDATGEKAMEVETVISFDGSKGLSGSCYKRYQVNKALIKDIVFKNGGTTNYNYGEVSSDTNKGRLYGKEDATKGVFGVSGSDLTYSGNEITPIGTMVELWLGSIQMEYNVKYYKTSTGGYESDMNSYSDEVASPKDAGWYKAQITLKAASQKYFDDGGTALNVLYYIKPATLTDSMLSLTVKSYDYDGQTHDITNGNNLKINGIADTNNYTIEETGKTGVAPGVYTLTVKGQKNYEGTATATWYICANLSSELFTFVHDGVELSRSNTEPTEIFVNSSEEPCLDKEYKNILLLSRIKVFYDESKAANKDAKLSGEVAKLTYDTDYYGASSNLTTPGGNGQIVLNYRTSSSLVKGTATLYFKPRGYYSGDTIEVKGISDYYAYTGSPIKPAGKLYYKNSQTLIPVDDYETAYENNTNAGTATIKYTLKNALNHVNHGVVETNFKIKYDLTTANISLTNISDTDNDGVPDRNYNGGADRPDVRVSYTAASGTSEALSEGTDFTIDWPTDTASAGKKEITIRAADAGKCFGNVTVVYYVNKLKIDENNTEITLKDDITSYTYTGAAIKPEVTSVTRDSLELSPTTDYKVEYSNNKNVGTGTVKIVAREGGNYTGSRSIDFTITPRSLTGDYIELRENGTITYTGDNLKSQVESIFDVYDTGMSDYKLVRDTDYKVVSVESLSADGTKNKWQVGDVINVVIMGSETAGTNYRSTGQVTYTLTGDVIKPANLTDGTFTKNGTEKEYSGNVIDPDFNITLAGATTALKKGTDYTVTYNDGINMVDAGAYKVTVTAKDNPNANSKNNIEGSNTFDFNVNKKELDYADASKSWPGDGDDKDTDDDVLDKYVIAAIPDMPYNAGNYVTPSVDIYDVSADVAGGSQQTIDGVAYANAKKLTENVDYRLSYENNTAGTDAAIVYISAMDSSNYSCKDPIKKTFAIGKSIAGAQVTVKPTYTYNGNEQKPAADSEISVVLDGQELTYGTDGYNVLFEGSDYTSAGTKQITITGVGGYYGNVTAEYTIEPKTVEAVDTDGDASNNVECTLDLNSTKSIGNKTYKSMLFDGKTCEPDVIVKDVATGAILVKDKDYELTYAGNTARTKNLSDLATVYVTIKNDGNYRGRIAPVWSEKFYIDGVDIAGLAMSGIDGNAYEWSGGDQGERIKQDIVITNGSKGTQLAEGTDYTVTFSTSPVSVGKYTITIRGIGNYSGSRTATVYIFADLSNDSYTTTSAATQHYSGSTVNPVITVTCAGKQLVQGTGANTQDADFYVSSCSPLDTHDWATATKGVATISGIDKNLYVLERTIEFNVDFSADGFEVTDDSDGSRTGSQIRGYTLSNQYIYTGSEIKPEFRLWDGNTEITSDSSRNTYYDENEVVYRSSDDGTDCINVGTVTVTIPIYTSVNGKKKSTKKEISYKIVPRAISSCQIDEIDLETYTGAAITPKLKVTYGNTELKEGSGSNGDYSVTFSNNVTPGRASVRVKGNGNYTGSVTEFFTIKPASVTSVNASTKTKTKIDVSWTPVSNVDGYQIIYKQGRSQKQVDVGSGQSAATLASLSQATDYTVQVRSYVLVGATKYYGTAGQTSAATKPATPVIKVTSPSTGQIKISWNKNTAATGYVVYRSTTKDGAYSKVKTITGSNKTAYINKKRTSGQRYYYYVRAYTVKNGKTVYSAASTKKGIRAK